jgi:hypothetical protein
MEADCTGGNITATTNETAPDVIGRRPQVHAAHEHTFQFPHGMLLMAFVVSLGGFVLVSKRLRVRVSYFLSACELYSLSRVSLL